MATSEDQPTRPDRRQRRVSTAARPPRVGEQRRPYNNGELGVTYTIYRFYDAADRLLYLGEFGRIQHRIAGVEAGSAGPLPLGHDGGPEPWWRQAVRIELQHLPPGTTDAEAKAEEAKQIELERPTYNHRRQDRSFDRVRYKEALDHAHFEHEVAAVEHERHDGLIRDLTQVEVESRRAADGLRPGGSALLDQVARQLPARPRRSWLEQTPYQEPGAEAGGSRDGDGHGPDRDGDAAAGPGFGREPRGRPAGAGHRASGPGSRLGALVVAAILAAVVIAALAVSLQAAF